MNYKTIEKIKASPIIFIFCICFCSIFTLLVIELFNFDINKLYNIMYLIDGICLSFISFLAGVKCMIVKLIENKYVFKEEEWK